MSTHVFVSAIISAPIDTVWNELRDFTFPAKMVGGASGTAVGAVRVVNWKNGAVQRHRLLEVSDARRTISWELVPGEGDDVVVSAVSAQITTVSLKRVTDNNTTFVSWETDFSSDVEGQNIKDCSEDSALNLKDLQAHFSK